MASLYYKDENGAYQPIGVKLLGGLSGGKTYMHFISVASIWKTTDDDIGGECTIVVNTSSEEKICGSSADKLADFLKKIGATQPAWAYPITMHTNGYTSTPWSGIYYDTTDGVFIVTSTYNVSGTGTVCQVTIGTMKERVIEM